MNEQMQKLELEAIAYADSKVPANDRYNDIYHSIVRGKFAELIVDECMLINRQRLFPDYEGDSNRVAHNNALLCANSDLREHFGVKE